MQDQRQREGGVIFAMLLLLTTEVMFFAGLISAYIVGRANAGAWPPPGQPRLPVEITAANTLLLLISGVIAVLFIRKRETLPVKLVLITGLLGLAFVGIQGFEWIRLVSYGLTTGSSLYGGFFYVIVALTRCMRWEVSLRCWRERCGSARQCICLGRASIGFL